MKRVLMATAGAIALAMAAQTALAADMPTKAPAYQAPVVAPIGNWSGIYLGLHGGGAWSKVDWGLDYPFGAPPFPSNFSKSSAIYGGHFGFQHQSGQWVYGAEFSLSDGIGAKSIGGVDLFGGVLVGEMRADIDPLFMATVRIGYASDRWLTYLKGGFASARIELFTDDNVPGDFLSKSKKTHKGWTIGVGGEYAFTNDWSFGLEYNYVDLGGRDTVQITLEDGSPIGSIASSRADTRMHSVLARLSYKFATGKAPVMANY
jgi:outer membrane immunogenic protein